LPGTAAGKDKLPFYDISTKKLTIKFILTHLEKNANEKTARKRKKCLFFVKISGKTARKWASRQAIKGRIFLPTKGFIGSAAKKFAALSNVF
jgi:hypothetical protein